MERDILQFLEEISAVQEQAIAVLTKKQRLLVKPDREGLSQIATEEKDILAYLDRCVKRREEILAAAKKIGKASDSIQTLSRQIFPGNPDVRRKVDEAVFRSRLIRNLNLTNWVMTQKSIIHLTQMLEIVATRGQGKPTYKRVPAQETGVSGGGFVDRTA